MWKLSLIYSCPIDVYMTPILVPPNSAAHELWNVVCETGANRIVILTALQCNKMKVNYICLCLLFFCWQMGYVWMVNTLATAVGGGRVIVVSYSEVFC